MKFNIFELRIFSFNSYVYYLTCGFTALNRVFNPLTRAFSLLTREFELVTRGFELVTRGLEHVTRKFELVTCGFEPITLGFELVSREFELIIRNSCLTFPQSDKVNINFEGRNLNSPRESHSPPDDFEEIFTRY